MKYATIPFIKRGLVKKKKGYIYFNINLFIQSGCYVLHIDFYKQKTRYIRYFLRFDTLVLIGCPTYPLNK